VGSLLPLLLEQSGSEFGEQRFDLPPVAQGALKERDQLPGNIPAAAFAALGEGEDESGVLLTAGASAAPRTEAGFTHWSNGAFDGRPELGQLLEKELFEIGIGGEGSAHEYGIC
jgi:hypothetical protein